jgi:hypothetical protein
MKMFNLNEELDIRQSIMTNFLVSFVISHGFLDVFKFKKLESDTYAYLLISGVFFMLLKLVTSKLLLVFLALSVEHFNNDLIVISRMLKLGTTYTYHKFFGYGTSVFVGTLLGSKNYNFYITVISYLNESRNIANVIYCIFLFITLLHTTIWLYYFSNKERLMSGVLILSGYLLGPFYHILYYLSFIHLPIAIMRLLKFNEVNIWGRILYVFFLIGLSLNNLSNSFIIYEKSDIQNIAFIGIAILLTHMTIAKIYY